MFLPSPQMFSNIPQRPEFPAVHFDTCRKSPPKVPRVVSSDGEGEGLVLEEKVLNAQRAGQERLVSYKEHQFLNG